MLIFGDTFGSTMVVRGALHIVDVCICAVFIFYSKYFFSGVGGWTEVVYIFFLYLCFYLFMYVCRAICMYACMYACMVITNTR